MYLVKCEGYSHRGDIAQTDKHRNNLHKNSTAFHIVSSNCQAKSVAYIVLIARAKWESALSLHRAVSQSTLGGRPSPIAYRPSFVVIRLFEFFIFSSFAFPRLDNGVAWRLESGPRTDSAVPLAKTCVGKQKKRVNLSGPSPRALK